MKLTDEQIESLRRFVLDVIEPWQDYPGDLDGFTLQDIAEKNKILVPHIVFAPCVEDGCNCSECYTNEEFQKGATCYRIADWLTRDAEQRNGADLPQHSGTFSNGQQARCANCGNTITYHVYNNYGWRHEEGLEPPMTPSMEICGKPVPS